MAIPFVKKSYDDRASAGRLSDLIRMRGSAEADQIRQQGQQSAQMWSSLGQMAGGTLSGLAQLKYEEPRRQYEAARYQREMDDFNEEDEVDRILDEGGTPDEIATKLMGAGRIGRETAQQIQEGITKKTREGLELQKLNTELTAQHLNTVAGYFAEMETAPEEQRATLWQTYRPKIQALVKEDPGEYSPDTFASKHQGLLQRIAPIQSRAEALALMEGRKKNQREIDESVLAAAPKYLTGVDTPEEWQQFVAYAKSLEASPKAIELIGDYTPENVARWSRVAAGAPKKYPVTTTGPGGGPMQKLATEDEMIAGVSGYRAPRESDRSNQITAAGRGTAERFKQQELAAAEKDFAEARALLVTPVDPIALAPDVAKATTARKMAQEVVANHEARKQRIQQSYEAQLGASRSVPRTATPPTPAGELTEDDVRSLATKGPGVYKMTDGTSWRLTNDGRVVRVK